MAKKKKKQQKTQVSGVGYLRSGRARRLPIHESFISPTWEETGLANIVVSRKHVNGNISFACFLVDIYCLGVKDALFKFNISEIEYQDFLDTFYDTVPLELTDYANVHNVIYGAVAFAEDYGFYPHNDFNLAKMILEEDTEDVPFIEYEFGVGGKPQLVVRPGDPRLSLYINKLKKNAGEGNYEVVYMDYWEGDDEDEEYDDFDEYDEEVSDYEDEDDLIKLEEFGPDRWENFILETEPESLFLFWAESLYIFEKAIYRPSLAGRQLAASGQTVERNMVITYEPLDNDQSEEEAVENQEIHGSLHLEHISPKMLKDLLQRIQSAVKKWPQNPIFHNYLINAYIRMGDVQQQKEAARALVERFPDYLFGKLSYAQLLLEEDKLDDVPRVFNNCFDLKSLLPEREVFHISELVSFNTLMCLYFIKKGDSCTAYMYRKMLDEMEIPDHMHVHETIFFKLDVMAAMQVKELIKEAQKNENKRKELVAILVS